MLFLISQIALIGWAQEAVSTPPTYETASGQALEDEIEQLFVRFGVERIKAKDWTEADLYRRPHLTAIITDAPYRSIYGHRAKIEFLFLHRSQQYLIETKRQRSAGSTDEKLPYVFANAKANISDGQSFILILDGDGWKPGAKAWIKDQAAVTDGFMVMTPDEFAGWLSALLGSD